jgi:hypothetical protein
VANIDRKKMALAGGLTAALLGAFLLGGSALGGGAAPAIPEAPTIAPQSTSWPMVAPIVNDRSRAVHTEEGEGSEGDD